MQYRGTLPGILCGIDGVLHRAGKKLPGSIWALKEIKTQWETCEQPRQPNGPIYCPPPFALLSNNIGDKDRERAEKQNILDNPYRLFYPEDGLSRSAHFPAFNKDDVLCCHTPLRKMVPDLGENFILIAGDKHPTEVCREFGFKKAIHIEELQALIPSAAPLAKAKSPRERSDRQRTEVLERFGVPEDQLIAQLKFEAMFVCADIFCTETSMQLIMDLLMSPDGRIGPAIRSKSDS